MKVCVHPHAQFFISQVVFLCSCLWAPPDQSFPAWPGFPYWLHFFLWSLVSDLHIGIKSSYLAQNMAFKPSRNEGWQKGLRSVWKMLGRIKLLPKANISEISLSWLAVDMDICTPSSRCKMQPSSRLRTHAKVHEQVKKYQNQQPSIKLALTWRKGHSSLHFLWHIHTRSLPETVGDISHIITSRCLKNMFALCLCCSSELSLIGIRSNSHLDLKHLWTLCVVKSAA